MLCNTLLNVPCLSLFTPPLLDPPDSEPLDDRAPPPLTLVTLPVDCPE